MKQFKTVFSEQWANPLALAKDNANVASLGVTTETLARIRGHKNASYAEVITDLEKMADNCATNDISITNFDEITNILTGSITSKRKGMHWIVEDLSKDVTTFNGKTLTLEFPVQNARETTSFLDVYCADCFTGGKRLLTEYKYGPNSITPGNIKSQFIERDLFNPDITSINQIQWRLKDTGFTKELLNQYLIQHKEAIKDLGYEKINKLFGTNFDEFTGSNSLSQSVIDYFNNNTNFNTIFKF